MRARAARSLIGALALCAVFESGVVSCADQQFVGPMNELMAQGISAASMKQGLAFAIALGDRGRFISNDRFDLRVPGAPGPLTLSLAPLHVEGLFLVGEARLINKTGVPVLGLRLDIVEATESVAEPGAERGDGDAPRNIVDAGRERSRPQPVSLRSPLLFGDLAPDAESPVLRFLAEGLSFAPDTTRVIVLGVVTGVAVVGEQPLPEVDPAAMDVDPSGRVFIADASTGRILRINKEGTAPVEVALLKGKRPVGLAVHPKTGDVFVSVEGSSALTIIPARRKRQEPIEGPGPLGMLRFIGGTLHAEAGGRVTRLADLRLVPAFTGEASRLAGIRGFDAASADTKRGFVVVSDGEAPQLMHVDPKGSVSTIGGRSAGLGLLPHPTRCRVDPDGRIWAVDTPAGATERITLFGLDGSLITALRLPGEGETLDLAPGKEGRMFALQAGRSGVPARLLTLRTF